MVIYVQKESSLTRSNISLFFNNQQNNNKLLLFHSQQRLFCKLFSGLIYLANLFFILQAWRYMQEMNLALYVWSAMFLFHTENIFVLYYSLWLSA